MVNGKTPDLQQLIYCLPVTNDRIGITEWLRLAEISEAQIKVTMDLCLAILTSLYM